jgi:hypothetical protein
VIVKSSLTAYHVADSARVSYRSGCHRNTVRSHLRARALNSQHGHGAVLLRSEGVASTYPLARVGARGCNHRRRRRGTGGSLSSPRPSDLADRTRRSRRCCSLQTSTSNKVRSAASSAAPLGADDADQARVLPLGRLARLWFRYRNAVRRDSDRCRGRGNVGTSPRGHDWRDLRSSAWMCSTRAFSEPDGASSYDGCPRTLRFRGSKAQCLHRYARNSLACSISRRILDKRLAVNQ